MRIVTSLTVALISIVFLARPNSAAAQCATKPDNVAQALSAKDAYSLAKAEAIKSNADSALVRMITTTGPLDAQGRSTTWMAEFFSPTAKKLTIVNFTSGAMDCNAAAIDGPFFAQPIGETADTIFDAERLVRIARDAGGSGFNPAGLTVGAALMRSGPDAPATWSISYVTPEGRPMLEVSIDSMSGVATGKTPR